ncbi:alkaline phosphatase family protein [candidate division WOR-3 bacterium]|nr:alkaline phosphatase family protein [candidate division WOR-3 bacterium]
MDKASRKLIILGLDGATFDVINPMLENGELPTFRKLMREGSYGKLMSTKIPISPSAWSSFLTGLNPENHGIFDFVKRRKGTYEHIPVNSTHRRGIPIWQILGEHNLECGVFNIPCTYPPEEVNGFIVSGFPVPPGKEYIKPGDFADELKKRFGSINLQPEYFYSEGKEKEFAEDQHRCWDETERLFEYLWKGKMWDVLIAVFKPTDEIMHGLWKSIDPTHPSYNEVIGSYRDTVLDLYRKADSLIDTIIENNGENIDLIIMSDHGFGPVHSTLYMNNWLIQHGYMDYKENFGVRFRRFLHETGLNLENAFKIGKRLGLSAIGKRIAYSSDGVSIFKRLMNLFFLSYKDIDWKRTKAYSTGNFGQIYINLRGREPEGIVNENEYDELVNEIIEKLKKFRDPRNGKIIFKWVLKRDEEFEGRFIEEAPDIVFFDEFLEYTTNRLFEFGSNKLVGSHVIDRSGDHKPYGIFFAYGDKFIKGKEIEGARIVDILPTVLYSLGIPVPDDIDGIIMDDIFTENFKRTNEPRYRHYIEKEKIIEESGKKEEEEIRKRLKGLGYA